MSGGGVLGIGLVGGGRHGRRYAHHLLHDVDGAKLVSFTRRDPEAGRAQAAEWGVAYRRGLEELVEDPAVGALVAVVPPHLHPEIVEAAAARRKPVLLEKPAAIHLADGRRMRDAAREASLPVMVAQTMRYNEVVGAVRRARDRVGPLHGVHIGFRFEPSPLDWVTDPAIAFRGNVLHTGIHSLDLLRHLTGREVERVSCEVSTAGPGRLDDNFSAVLRMEGGLLATVVGCRATRSRSGAIDLVGAEGQIVADHVLRRADLLTGKNVEPLPLAEPVPTVREAAREFVRAVRGGSPMPVPLEEGLRSLALVEACYRAAEEGRAVAVETP